MDTIPALPTDPGDCNRTATLAFTGNRFESRAPGSGQSIAGPLVTLNTIMAEDQDHIATELEAALAAGTEFDVAVQKLLEDIITVHGGAVFNGDGYSEDWLVEAAARGLPNLRTTLDALPELVFDEAVALFSRYAVFNEREQHSRYEIALEQDALSIGVKARLTLSMGSTAILPAAARYQTELAANLAALQAVGVETDPTPLDAVSGPLTALRTALAALRTALAALRSALHHGGAAPTFEEARHARDVLLPAMGAVRAAADELECHVADDLWLLPTYQEMLFI